ncbi:MAG TPA: CDP-diacylglycerol--glycerol-3-phosphate 3-phosphatidyltransferase, partial [Terrimicrobiaceae bacterium]|nr:CDP-diacylglycerol--glycerol-3-phosphate 3-phosphatidyltransferase [Terrimicrobiaceae bacterium]
MNLPNILTLLRLGLTVLLVASLSVDYPFHFSMALLVFLLASLTDYLDGVIARKWDLITDFGKLMDPLADKILTASAFICLIPFGALPAWAVIIIISREFLITGLRLLASSKGIILPAEKLGKHKTAWQMITIVFFLALLAADDFAPEGTDMVDLLWGYGGAALVTVTVALTVFSGLAYLWKNRRLLSPDEPR